MGLKLMGWSEFISLMFSITKKKKILNEKFIDINLLLILCYGKSFVHIPDFYTFKSVMTIF